MKTTLFTVNDLGDPEPVIATVRCKRITIGEDVANPGWPMHEYFVLGPYMESVLIQRPAGTSFVFDAPYDKGGIFSPGQIAGYVTTLVGSTTFYKVEM